MREIKFRAWDANNNKMYQVDTLGLYVECGTFTHHAEPHWDDETNTCMALDGCPIMQFTGLKDKNGVEIYEGDIVKAIDVVSSVEWSCDGFWEIAAPGTAESVLLVNHVSVLEVIGNIYEHPELLQGVEK